MPLPFSPWGLDPVGIAVTLTDLVTPPPDEPDGAGAARPLDGPTGEHGASARDSVPGLRTAVLIGSTAVLAWLAAGAIAARPLLSTAASARCAAGSKPGIVGGTFRCLKEGQTCTMGRQADYVRSGFWCRAGRLRAKTTTTRVEQPPTGPGSSRTNPVPLGKPGALGNGWTLTVTGVNPDAAGAVLAVDPNNKPPLEGYQYVLVSVSATYGGTGSSHLTPATSLRAIGASGFAHSSSNSFCGTLPSPNLDTTNPLVFGGGTITGYAACWMVAKADVPSLDMYYQPLLGGPQVWFALH